MTRDINEVAIELIDLKKEMVKLLEKEKELKKEIKPLLSNNNNQISIHKKEKIILRQQKASGGFTKKEVLNYIEDEFSEIVANQVEEHFKQTNNVSDVIYVVLK